MNYSLVTKIFLSAFFVFFIAPDLSAQTKKLKRPRNRVGISSVDRFVRESFDLYDKVYKYDGYAANGTPLEDEDIDILEDALDDVTGLSESAPDIIDDLDGTGALKQAKATLQINRAKKALKYSIKTAKELLLGQRGGGKDNEDEKKDENTDSNNENTEESTDKSSEKDDTNENDTVGKSSNSEDELEIYSQFDFVPGDKLLFFDDFSQDFVGDFPAKWNTNGLGEVAKFSDDTEKWFELKAGNNNKFIPDIKNLPENYTIEFDIRVVGTSRTTSVFLGLKFFLSDDDSFSSGKSHHVEFKLPLHQKSGSNVRVSNYFNNGGGGINSTVPVDITKALKNQAHVAISVNKQRFRVWVNNQKLIDIPRLITELGVLNFIKFGTDGFKAGKERVFINNFKVAEGGEDLRRKLMSEGRISTNGILFDSGSANIKPQSLGVVRQISQVLNEDSAIKLNIIGHTDADGADDINLKLSKARADAVKEILVTIYNISSERLSTEGKGETQPVGDNKTTNGKAQNRRVEFVKI